NPWPKTTTLVEPGHRSPANRRLLLVQAALSPLNLLKTMQLKKLPLVARHWHSACILSGRPSSRARMKFNLIAVSAQNPADQERIDFAASNKERAQQGAPRHDRHY